MMNEIILGILQGITEWLPVSSSGHLVIYQELFNTGTPVFLDLMLHIATLFVIFVVFYKEIWQVASAFLHLDFKSEHGRMSLFIIAGTVPIIVVGLLFQDMLISLFENLYFVSIALIINGTVLFLTKYAKGRKNIGWVDSLIIGSAQAFAIVPGISRSGSTISAALFRGVDRQTAAAYSFMLAIPAIAGAAVLNIDSLGSMDISAGALTGAMISAVIVGYVSLRLLLHLVRQQKLHYFAYYCWALGIILLVAQSI